MKLLESTRNKITKGKNVEVVSHLKIDEVLLIHCKRFSIWFKSFVYICLR